MKKSPTSTSKHCASGEIREAELADDTAALDLLQNAYAEGDRRRWWNTFERDAGFDTIRGHPCFQALAARAKAHAAPERVSLEQMRDRGYR